MPPRTELPFEVKRFITEALACHDSPTTVVKAVKDKFDLDVTRQAVHRYDPTAKAGAELNPVLVRVFHQRREKFFKEPDAIPIANLSVRLRKLNRRLDYIEEKQDGNHGMALRVMEQAAKEMGGAYTNRREVSGPGGKPIETADTTPRKTPEQVNAEFDALLRGSLGLGRPATDAPADNRVVEAPAGGSGPPQPGPGQPAPGGAVAVPERPVLFAGGDLPED